MSRITWEGIPGRPVMSAAVTHLHVTDIATWEK